MKIGSGNSRRSQARSEGNNGLRYIPKKQRAKFKLYQQLLRYLLALILFLAIVTNWPLQSHTDAANAVTTIQLPLSARGANIVDAKGRTVLLRGVNWFGMETETHAPHGLWSRDYKEMLAQMRSLGYNFIRLPYSVASLKAPEVSGIDFKIGSNEELEGKTPLEVMDSIIQEAERQGLLILLDSHRLDDERIPELWYGDGFTELDWIDAWKMLAFRYKNQANIIGADLFNEPHGRASWGTNNRATDWRLAAERAGNAILSINPNWLIVVQGVEKNVPGQKLKIHWKGGNLEGVRRFPVRLSVRNKVVYSPHEYGTGVYEQPWFSERSFPKNLYQRWETGFNYIASRKIAPILIGEFGGRQIDTSSKEGIWQNQFMKYIAQKNLSFAYWSWNPNSADTGGVLLDDWQNIDQPKQQLLSKLLKYVSFAQAKPLPLRREVQGGQRERREPIIVSPLSSPSRLSSPSPLSSPLSLSSASARLKVTTDIQSDWETGFCVSMKVTNQGSTSVSNWQLKFTMNQAAINNAWNGNFKPEQGKQYVVTPLDWGRVIEPSQVREVGFCANKLGSDYKPTGVEVISSKS